MCANNTSFSPLRYIVLDGLSVDPRAVRRHHDPMDLVTLAQQVQKADEFVQATTSNKLKMIVDQIKYLQGQVCTYTEECRQQQCSVGKLV